jgi:hypothetical protein
MEINDMMLQNISSIRHTINLSNLKKAMNQDAQTMAALLDGMQTANAKIVESSVLPHKGGSIDVRI